MQPHQEQTSAVLVKGIRELVKNVLLGRKQGITSDEFPGIKLKGRTNQDAVSAELQSKRLAYARAFQASMLRTCTSMPAQTTSIQLSYHHELLRQALGHEVALSTPPTQRTTMRSTSMPTRHMPASPSHSEASFDRSNTMDSSASDPLVDLLIGQVKDLMAERSELQTVVSGLVSENTALQELLSYLVDDLDGSPDSDRQSNDCQCDKEDEHHNCSSGSDCTASDCSSQGRGSHSSECPNSNNSSEGGSDFAVYDNLSARTRERLQAMGYHACGIQKLVIIQQVQPHPIHRLDAVEECELDEPGAISVA